VLGHFSTPLDLFERRPFDDSSIRDCRTGYVSGQLAGVGLVREEFGA
jgi:hypothetical protein